MTNPPVINQTDLHLCFGVLVPAIHQPPTPSFFRRAHPPVCDFPDAAAAEGSQRMLAQVNARIEAQRRGGGGVLGSRPSGSLADQDAASGIGQSQLRNLAEKHGIVVRFVDDGAASGFAQVRALARAHGIRVQILGQDGDGGRGCFGEHGEESGAPLGGDGGDKAAGSDVATPPPILSSLRTRATPARRSPSPVPETLVKVRSKRFRCAFFCFAFLVRVRRRWSSSVDRMCFVFFVSGAPPARSALCSVCCA